MPKVIQTDHGKYILTGPADGIISTERDILDLMTWLSEIGDSLLLISEGALHPDFFDLSTGLAGEIALKLSAYRVRTAIVVDLDSIPSQPFREWAGECNRGREIYFCAEQNEAESLLFDLEG